jgi:chromosome segregation ATPase
MSLRVLVFDGDSPLASSLELALARLGCDVVRQGERSSFMAAALAKAPALIIFGYQPGRTESFSVCLAVRRDSSLAKVPTVVASTYAVEAEFEKFAGTTLRADAYFASVTSAEELLIRLRDVVPSLPAAPPSGPGIEILEEGFAGDDMVDVDDLDDDAHTVVGRIPDELFFRKEPEPESANRPTVDIREFAVATGDDEPVVDLVVPVDDDESIVALGTMPDAEEILAQALPRAASMPPPMPAPAPSSAVVDLDVPSHDADADAERARAEGAASAAEAFRTQAEAAARDHGAQLASARADVEAREREVATLKASLVDSDRQLEELRGKLTSASKGQSNVSMKEFLDLREQIGKRDRELLQVREELTKKDRELFDERDRSLALERSRAETDEAITELTRSKLGAEEIKDRLEGDLDQVVARLKAADAAAEEQLASLADERNRVARATDELHALRAEKVAADEALVAARAEQTAKNDEAAQAQSATLAALERELATLRENVSKRDLAVANAEALVETREVELTNLAAQKAAAEVELIRLREEAVGFAEAHEADQRTLTELRGTLETTRSSHQTLAAALRAELGSTIDRLEADVEARRVDESVVRGELEISMQNTGALTAKLEGAEHAHRDALSALAASEATFASRDAASTDTIASLTAQRDDAQARALSLEAEANGVCADLDVARSLLADLQAANAREAGLRHDGLERARDALAVVLAELDALPVGQRQ